MQAFAVIATSPLRIDLSCVLDHLIAELTGFLRKVFGFFPPYVIRHQICIFLLFTLS